MMEGIPATGEEKMGNLRMVFKLGLGFGLVMALMCALSWLAVMVMSEQKNRAEAIVDIYMPELALGVKVERGARDTMAAMLRYTNTEDVKYVEKAKGFLQEIQKQAQAAEKLVGAYPQLKKLEETLGKAKTILTTYSAQVEQSASLLEDLKKRRLVLTENGERYISVIQSILRDQEERLDRAIAAGEPVSEVQRRMETTRNLNRLLDLGAAVRLSNFQSQVLQDPAIADRGIANFEPILALLKVVNENVKRSEAHEQIRQITEAALAYRKNFQTLVQEWKNFQALTGQHASNAEALVAIAQETARTGLTQMEELTTASVSTSQSGMKTLVAGVIAGILIGCLLALLLTRAITGPLRKSVAFAESVAGGKLDEELDIRQKDEVGHLADALNTMVAALRQRIADAHKAIEKASAKEQEALAAMREADETRREAEQAKRQGMLDAAAHLEDIVASVASASEELSAQVEQSENGTQKQAARVGETATAMEEMNATVLEVAKNAGNTASVSEQAKAKAQDGADIVQQVIGGMERIRAGSEELRADMAELSRKAAAISTIMDVISDIADQTNLLALNAAIEAARAGEAGRGFAVVADEVRKLAEKTMQATAEVGEAIQGIQSSTTKNMANVETSVATVHEVTDMAATSGQALDEIVTLVDQASDQVRAIATASEQQSATSEEINRAIEDISVISSETADAMRLSAQAVQELSHQAQSLERLIREMKQG